MREEYDFSKGKKNPYMKKFKKQFVFDRLCSTEETAAGVLEVKHK